MRRRLKAALFLNTLVVVVETVGGVSANSLGLLADALHNFVDEASLFLALYAFIQGSKPASGRRTFGYHRREVMAAWANSGALILLTLGLVVLASLRILHPVAVHGTLMWTVGSLASLGNLGVALVLRTSSRGNLNVRSAYVHNLGDALLSLCPAAAGFLISSTGWMFMDPAASLLIGAAVVTATFGILKEANAVILEGTPPGIESQAVVAFLQSLPGVRSVHDLHIWSEGPQLHLLTCELLVQDRRISEGDQLLKRVRRQLFQEFGISHATVQLETASCHPQVLYCDLKKRLAHHSQLALERA